MGHSSKARPEPVGWLSNAGSLVAGRLVVAALGWTGTVIVARSLDQDEFGRFTFVFGLLGMMTIATDMGLGRIAISGVLPDAPEPGRFTGTYIVLRCGLGLLGYVLAVGFTVVGSYPAEIVRATAIAGLVVVLATISHAYEIVLQANLRMQAIAVSAVIGRFGQLALTVAVAVAGGGFIWFLVPAVLAEVVIMAVKIPAAVRLLPVSYAIKPRLWSAMLREAVPISIGTALATLYFRVDSIMLSKLDDFAAVGIYGVAFKFVDVLHFIALSISAPVLTVLVRSWPDDLVTFGDTVQRTAALFLTLAGALVVYFGLFATQTIEALYGSAYREGGDAATLLVIGEIIGFASVLGLTMLTASSHHRPYPYLALAGLVLNIGLNLWAIPRWSFEGAAATTIVTELLVIVGMGFLVRRMDGLSHFGVGLIARAALPAAGALVVGALAAARLSWPLAAAMALGVYAMAVAASGLLTASGVPELARSRVGR